MYDVCTRGRVTTNSNAYICFYSLIYILYLSDLYIQIVLFLNYNIVFVPMKKILFDVQLVLSRDFIRSVAVR